MKIHRETDRIILREMVLDDKYAMFELDADPEVHTYLWKNPIKRLDEAEAMIEMIRAQYVSNGIGRWAIIDKESNEFVGWGGLKLITKPVNNHIDFYDVGYRLLRRFWGKGYATESAIESVAYAFESLNAPAVYGMTHPGNNASRNALQKAGLQITGTCDYEGLHCNWFEITRQQWEMNKR